MSFVTANRWSQVSPDRQIAADLRFIDGSTVVRATYVADAACVLPTATV